MVMCGAKKGSVVMDGGVTRVGVVGRLSVMVVMLWCKEGERGDTWCTKGNMVMGGVRA